MKVTKMREELRTLSSQELDQRLEEARRKLFSLKLNKATAHVKDSSLFKKLRKDIARMLAQKNKK